MAGIITIAVVLTFFTILFLLFGMAQVDRKIGVWIVVMILFTIVLGWATESQKNQGYPRTHPSYILGEYSN